MPIVVKKVLKRETIIPQVIDIHKAFAAAWEQVQHFYKSEIAPAYHKSNSGFFIAELDKNTHTILLHFVIQGNVLRQGAVKVDLAFLFPIVNQDTGDVISEGIDMKELLRMEWNNVIFKFIFHNSEQKGALLCRKFKVNIDFSKNHIIDDIGEVWIKGKSIEALSINPIPSELLIKYNLVGVFYQAKYTNVQELDCVLFAEIDNAHDSCAIKVLRWFPEVRNGNQPSKKEHLFFHLGYISRAQNTELHDYMVKNNSRILFAKCHNSRISIKGGVRYLEEEKLYYPLCLIDIPVYE